MRNFPLLQVRWRLQVCDRTCILEKIEKIKKMKYEIAGGNCEIIETALSAWKEKRQFVTHKSGAGLQKIITSKFSSAIAQGKTQNGQSEQSSVN